MGQSIIEGEIIHFFEIQRDAIAREIGLLFGRFLRRNRPKDILHRRCGAAGQPQEMRMKFSEVGRLKRRIEDSRARWAD
jgi:hypothetical protein